MNTKDSHQLDTLLSEAIGRVAPAIVCRVEQHGRILYEAAFGQMEPYVDDRPIDVDTLFDLASLTKLFTTTACLQLCTQGKLNLEMRIVDVIPEFGGRRPVGRRG